MSVSLDTCQAGDPDQPDKRRPIRARLDQLKQAYTELRSSKTPTCNDRSETPRANPPRLGVAISCEREGPIAVGLTARRAFYFDRSRKFRERCGLTQT